MKGIMVGAAIGYVLGAKAGRERYDQIVRLWHRFTSNPTVRKTASQAKDKAFEAAHQAKDLAADAAEKASEKAPWKNKEQSNGLPVTRLT
ncbi:YtxH domain-containing protein [Lentzea sp. NPDC060358]|uniref:YtxH domain-containing protein n=1 Tax=Lentzea sp. NPDC060358 TaxID=3347103 RepID=UPI00366136B4